MKHNLDMDPLLRQALSPKEEPNDQLNRNILWKAKETEEMNKKYFKRIPATAIIAAAVLLVGSVSTVAAWRYLTPEKVAEVLEDEGLIKAFQSKDAILVNESQEYGNYKITLLGVVSGKNLTQYLSADETGNLREDRTYVVTAIENADGTPRPAISEESYLEESFFVSPLIEGLDPNRYNSVTMNGGYSETVQNGVQYRITEVDNVEIFADRPLYLSVNSGTFYDSQAYQFDAASGKITRNEEYEGINALFALPLDASKADPDAAGAYIQKLEKELFSEGEEGDADVSDGADDGSSVLERHNWTEEELEKNAVLLEDLTQVLQPDAQGNYSYSYEIGEDGVGSSGTLSLDVLFEDGQTGMSDHKFVIGGEEGQAAYIETYTLNEDKTITLKVYQCKDAA